MINKILVPIDFSRGSSAALHYAEAFAVAVDAELLKVIHVFSPQTATTASSVYVPSMEDLMHERDQQLSTFLEQNPAPAGLRRTSELLLGFAADKIIAEGEHFDLIILGTDGETDLLEEVFGSVSSAVAQKANAPVLLVPNKARFKDYQHVLYASNSLSLSRNAVVKFKAFNQLFDARVHFVHVNDEAGTPEPGEREALFAPLFSNPDPEFAFELHEVNADTVQEGLSNYLNRYPIDLAVMVTKRRGFWERLFHHSETRQMVLHPETAMLILHQG
ncbi:MAG: universal stress protein [Bacteroidota bacterium]